MAAGIANRIWTIAELLAYHDGGARRPWPSEGLAPPGADLGRLKGPGLFLRMRYWAYFAGKLAVAAALLYGALNVINKESDKHS